MPKPSRPLALRVFVGALALAVVGGALPAAARVGVRAIALTEAPVCRGVALYPSPGTPTASPTTQISFRQLTPRQLRAARITVVGSVSGAHTGRLVADSDGQGASLYPSRPFTPGETVTVTINRPVCGAASDADRFTIASPPPAVATPVIPQGRSAPASKYQHYVSRPDLTPPTVAVTVHKPTAAGDLFVSPAGGPGAHGPMILAPDGSLVWFDPLPRSAGSAMDFREQTYHGQPVLTWWQGAIVGSGHGLGEDVIMNSHYRVIATVHAGNGYHADLHEFKLDARGHAWITAYNLVGIDLRASGGPEDGAVWDGIVQEIDVATGNVLVEWHSLQAVPIGATYESVKTATTSGLDYFHVNAIQPQAGGSVLISSRNTDAAYMVDEATGHLLWQLGGKHSTFTMGPLTFFRLQHDVRYQGQGLVTVFDDQDQAPGRLRARGLELRLNPATRTATLVHQYYPAPRLAVPSQGSLQPLANGDVLVGWGQVGSFTEYAPSGAIVFNAQLSLGFTYRAYRSTWSGQPTTRPALVVSRDRARRAVLHASWNGATAVARWVVLAGPSAARLRAVAAVARHGFETALTMTRPGPVYAVRAVSAAGAVLGTSPAASAGTAG